MKAMTFFRRLFAIVLMIAAFPGMLKAGYTLSTPSTTDGDSSFTGSSILRMTGYLSGSNVTFTVTKTSGSFTSNCNVYLKVGAFESFAVNRDSGTISQGGNQWSSTHNLNNYPGYPKSFYFRVEPVAGGWAWVGPIIVNYTNSAPTKPSISSSPSTATVGQTVSIEIWRGTDPDGDNVKVQATASNSNRTDGSPYISSWATGGTSTTATFIFSAAGTQTIWATTFDVNGNASPTASRTITVSNPPPFQAPTLYTPSNYSTNVVRPVNFSWSSVSGATGYRIQIATSSSGWDNINGFQSQYLQVNEALSGTSYSWSGTAGNTTYYWSVRAGSPSAGGYYAAYFRFTTADNSPFPPPTLYSPSNNASNVQIPVNFSWSSISGITAYRIQIATSPSGWDNINGFQSQYLILHELAYNPSYTWSGAEAGKKYYWSVRGGNSNTGAGGYFAQYYNFTTSQQSTVPTAAFSGSPLSGTAPLTVKFTDQSQAGTGSTLTGWLWNFGDELTSTDKNPSHTYSSPGQYTVTLTVTNSFNMQDTLTKESYINVIPPDSPEPTAAFSGTPRTGNTPLFVQFTDQSQPGESASINNWLWDFGDGATSIDQNPGHIYNSARLYTVTLTVTNSFNKQDTLQKESYINVIQPDSSTPTAAFSGTPRSGNSPLFVQFTDQSQPGEGASITDWYWDFGDGVTSIDQNPNHTYSTPGIYTVTLMVTNSFNNPDTLPKESYINVKQPDSSVPTAAFSGTPRSGNAPLTVQFTDQSQPGEGASLTDWYWDFGDGATSIEQNPSHTYNATGSYTVTLTVTNSSNKQDTLPKTNYITVPPESTNPIAIFAASPRSGYAPLTVQFIDESLPGDGAAITEWHWDFGDGKTDMAQNPIHTFTARGNYTVTLTVRNSFDKQATRQEINYINVTTATTTPIAAFWGTPRSGYVPLIVEFTDQSQPGKGASITDWFWNFGDGTTEKTQHPTHTYPSVGTYTVTLTVTNSLGKKSILKETNYIEVSKGKSLIGLSRTKFNFAATTSGATTGDALLFINNTGEGILKWTAASNSSWLKRSPGSGTNSGTIKISVDPNGLYVGTYTGKITISAPNAGNSPRTVSVTLKVHQTGDTTPPFGEFSTPTDNSIVSSSVPVTGWALDDVGIESVKIYNGNNYIGDAVFVEGARPDLEQAYSSFPMNHKAGWGYMLLTNFLPRGGNGNYTLIAKAADKEGKVTTLGSKTIRCDNAHAVKPFGAIDTPTQGGAASKADFRNWGWVLTPQPNKIPTNGSSINVYVDGAKLGHPQYNLYRSDIAGLFPGYANSNGASGYYIIDTTSFKNGVHTIQWTVRDSAGNSDGVGSRYFTIQNKGSNPNSVSTSYSQTDSSETGSDAQISPYYSLSQISEIPVDCIEPVQYKKGYSENWEVETNYPGENGTIDIALREDERVTVYLNSDWIGIEDLQGKEPQSSDTSRGYEGVSNYKCSGYQVFGELLKPLPIGSTLESGKGIFYWQPGPGFVGEYMFVFILESPEGSITQKKIKIQIVPKF